MWKCNVMYVNLPACSACLLNFGISPNSTINLKFHMIALFWNYTNFAFWNKSFINTTVDTWNSTDSTPITGIWTNDNQMDLSQATREFADSNDIYYQCCKVWNTGFYSSNISHLCLRDGNFLHFSTDNSLSADGEARGDHIGAKLLFISRTDSCVKQITHIWIFTNDYHCLNQ